MKGLELLNQYTDKRDYSGSKDDNYAQELSTMYFHLRGNLFSLLEKAEKSGKRLAFKKQDSEVIKDDYFPEDIIYVEK